MTRAVALALLLVGCSGGGAGGAGGSGGAGGGSGGAGGGGASSITAEQACTNFSTAYCARVATCFPFAISAFYGTQAACIARSKLICLPPLALTNTGSSPAKVDGCVAGLNSASCGAVRAGTAGCRFSGMLAAGTACGAGSQCASGYCKLTSAQCGVCAARVANGGNCSASEDCQDGSKCVNAVCVAKRTAGAACSMTAPCGELLYCKSSVCTAVATTVGAACDLNDSDSCDYLSGLYCDDNSGTCARMSLAGPGQACGAAATSFTVCSAGGTCKTNGGLAGSCVAPAADGQACNSSSDLNCLDPASCEAGVCKLYNPGSCL